METASPGNRHCASCIGTLSFPIYTPGPRYMRHVAKWPHPGTPSASAPIATHHNNGDDLDYQRVIRSMFWLKLYPCRSVPLLAPNPGDSNAVKVRPCIIGKGPDSPSRSAIYWREGAKTISPAVKLLRIRVRKYIFSKLGRVSLGDKCT